MTLLEEAVQATINDALAVCGGDGKGCAESRPYYSSVVRRWGKCGRCPMDVILPLLEHTGVLRKLTKQLEER